MRHKWDLATFQSAVFEAEFTLPIIIPSIETLVGLAAAVLSSLSYIPQVQKVWAGQPTDDLSLHTLVALTFGLCLWVAYGALRSDWIIFFANLIGASLTGFVLFRKVRE